MHRMFLIAAIILACLYTSAYAAAEEPRGETALYLRQLAEKERDMIKAHQLCLDANPKSVCSLHEEVLELLRETRRRALAYVRARENRWSLPDQNRLYLALQKTERQYNESLDRLIVQILLREIKGSGISI